MVLGAKSHESTPGGGGGGGGGLLLGILGRGVLQILTQFQTKTCDFPHPFSDLASEIHTHFQISVVPKLGFKSVTKSRIGKIQLE